VTSPCAVAGKTDRVCSPASSRFVEVHGTVTNPIVQQGTRPYLVPGPDGKAGSIAFDSNGNVMVQGSEDLCVSLSIPKTGPMPAAGWPIVIYSHGTGGSFTSAIGDFASGFAEIDDASGHSLSRVAVLGYDNVMHGPRQGLPPEAWKEPGNLFFNVASPRAARDNVLQGAGDLFNLVRLLETLEIPASVTGLSGPTRFDPSHIMMYGHSQGTVVAPAFLANESNLRAAILSGAGAEIGISLVEKKKPNDVATLTRTIFADQSLTRLHPVFGLISFFFNAADAIPYGGAFARSPPAGRHALDYLHVYGLEDGYVPEDAQQALARNVGAPLIGTVLRPVSGVTKLDGPASANLNGATVGVLQYEPPTPMGQLAYDGHFVDTNDPLAAADIAFFIATAATSTAVIQR
jgi:predicted esterase